MGAAEDQLARIQQMERIHALEGKTVNGQPGVAAIGTPDGPTAAAQQDNSLLGSTIRGAGHGLSATAKALDVLRGTTTGPVLGTLLEKLSGKPVFKGEDVANAVNPTNLQKFPSASEMYQRAGVPEGAKMSDYVPGYADPAQNNPWYQPEKGGMLDFTLRGAGGTATDMAIDPLTYLTMGGASAAKKALASDATKQVLEASAKGLSPGAKALEMATSGAPKGIEMGTLEQAGKTLKNTPVAGTLATPASTLLSKWGKGAYNAVMEPVERQGLKYGKSDIGDVFYKAGVASPFGVPQKAGKAVDALMEARNAIDSAASKAGAQVSMSEAMAPIADKIAQMRATQDPNLAPIADALEAKMSEYLKLEKGTPGVPASTSQVPTGILDETGNPVMKSQVTPEVPAIPGRKVSPSDARGYTSSLYSTMPGTSFAETVKTPIGAQGQKAMAAGLKDATNATVGRALTPNAENVVDQLNMDAGKLLSTKQGQVNVTNQANRSANNLHALTGTDTVMGGLATIKGDEKGGLTAIALKKGLDLLRLGTMPAAYGARKLGESQLAAPAMDALARQKIKEYFGQSTKGE